MRGDRGDSPAAAVVSRVADGGRQIADYLDRNGPEGVLREVQDFARRRPGAFLATALAAGFVVGRLGKGVAKADPDAGETKPASDSFVSVARPGYRPDPAYAGATATTGQPRLRELHRVRLDRHGHARGGGGGVRLREPGAAAVTAPYPTDRDRAEEVSETSIGDLIGNISNDLSHAVPAGGRAGQGRGQAGGGQGRQGRRDARRRRFRRLPDRGAAQLRAGVRASAT